MFSSFSENEHIAYKGINLFVIYLPGFSKGVPQRKSVLDHFINREFLFTYLRKFTDSLLNISKN